MSKNYFSCNYCGADLGDSEALDAHAGSHPLALASLRVPADQSRRFHPHQPSCQCEDCEWIRDSIAREKKAYAEGLR